MYILGIMTLYQSSDGLYIRKITYKENHAPLNITYILLRNFRCNINFLFLFVYFSTLYLSFSLMVESSPLTRPLTLSIQCAVVFVSLKMFWLNLLNYGKSSLRVKYVFSIQYIVIFIC